MDYQLGKFLFTLITCGIFTKRVNGIWNERSVVSVSPTTKLSDLLENQYLHAMKFGGGEYQCSEEDWKTLKLLSNRRVIFHLQQRSSCIHTHRRCRHLPSVIAQILCEYDTVPNCDMLRCTCTILPELFGVNVRCNNSELPSSVPETTLNLLMHDSNLKDFGKWLVHLNIPHVSRIDLRNNSLTMLPYIPPSSMKSLRILHLSKNLIQKLDLNTLRFYRKYFDLKISIDGNPLICDCGMAGITNFLMNSDPEILDEQLVFCKYMNRTTRPWLVDFSNCFKEDYPNLIIDCWILLLVLINLIVIYIFVDTSKALKEARTGTQDSRTPVLAKFLTQMRSCWSSIELPCWRKSHVVPEKKKTRKESVLEMLLNSHIEQPSEEPMRKRQSEPAISTPYRM